MATLRLARSERRRSTNLPTRIASMAVRSVQVNMSSVLCSLVKVHRWWQPVQVTPSAPGRPAYTMGTTEPSSSGMATMMVDSTGMRPRSEPPHWSRVWNSTG